MAMVAVLLGSLMVTAWSAVAARADETRVFTVANYPIDAAAQNAVAAKQMALADGQVAALRSLLKRLVPVTRHHQLRDLKLANAAEVVRSLRVRREERSRTEYFADLDIAFEPDGVRKLLGAAGIPMIEEQAEPTTLVLIYQPPDMVNGAVPEAFSGAKGADEWRRAWAGLDLKNSLTPLETATLNATIHPDTVKMVLSGEPGGQRILAGEYGTERVVLALMQPDLARSRLNITLGGQDAVGAIRLARAFRFDADEFAYHAELAAVIAQGILEGRWKATRRPTRNPFATAVAAPFGVGPGVVQQPGSQPAVIRVQFRSLRDWQRIRQTIENTRGVARLDVEGLTPRAADISVTFAGPQDELARALSGQGLAMEAVQGGWLIR